MGPVGVGQPSLLIGGLTVGGAKAKGRAGIVIAKGHPRCRARNGLGIVAPRSALRLRYLVGKAPRRVAGLRSRSQPQSDGGRRCLGKAPAATIRTPISTLRPR
jgi:hypothetical protein